MARSIGGCDLFLDIEEVVVDLVDDEATLIRAVDELHDGADVSATTWEALTKFLSDEQLLDVLMLAGWYHAISFAANGARVPLED